MRLYKSFAFLFGIIAVLLILLKILVYDNALGQNFLKLANFPLTAFIFTSFSGIIMPGAVGRTYSYLEFLGLYIPYYIFYILAYIGYGFIVDLIIRKC